MGTVKISATLPKEPADNGLQDHSYQLLKSGRSDQFVIVAVVEVQQEITDRWKGTRVPVLGIAHVELIEDDDDADDATIARRVLDRAKDKRFARAPLPLSDVDRARYRAAGLLPFGERSDQAPGDEE